jgi:hypothetical protein
MIQAVFHKAAHYWAGLALFVIVLVTEKFPTCAHVRDEVLGS